MIASLPFRDGTASGVLTFRTTTRLTLSSEATTTVPVTTNAVRVVGVRGFHVAIGPDTEATVDDLFVPAGRVEVMACSPGDLVSVLQSPQEVGGGFAWISEVAG